MKIMSLLAAASFAFTAPVLAQSPGASQPSTHWPAPAPSLDRSVDQGVGQTTGQGAGQTAGQGAGQTTGAAPASGLSTQDFVRRVAISDMFEIQASQIAKQKASGEHKEFAGEMEEDHTESTNELKSMVSEGKVQAQLPTALDDEHRQKLEQLRQLSGKEFQDAFKRMQVEAHQRAIELFTSYAQAGDNAELKKWAADKLDDLKEHLSEANKLN